MNTDKTIPLERVLSKMGVLSRNKTRRLIDEGRVKVNDVVIKRHFHPVNPAVDVILIDGKPVEAAELVYIMLNKAPGYITSTLDDKSRENLFHDLPESINHLFPLFRLDNSAEGMMFFTNDNSWAQKLRESIQAVSMTYQIQIKQSIDNSIIEEMRAGVQAPGEILKFDNVSLLKASNKSSILRVVLNGDDYTVIRRMCAFFEFNILHFVRTAVGTLELGGLEKGTTRLLSKKESGLVFEKQDFF